MQEAQKLMVDFNDYPSVFLRMLSSCIQAPQNHIAVLLMEPSGNARMDFIQVTRWCCWHARSGLCDRLYNGKMQHHLHMHTEAATHMPVCKPQSRDQC